MRNKTNKSVDEVRKDFETSILFRPELHGGEQGFLIKRANGTFVNHKAELLFQGYAMARENDDAQLRRYAPDRHIGTGHMTEIHEALENEGHGLVSMAQIRTILKVVGGWPI